MTTETSITISSHDCEHACLLSIEQESKEIDLDWELRIKEEMTKKPFLWIFYRPAKTREVAIKRIKEEYESVGICAGFLKPGVFNEMRIREIKKILNMCRKSESIGLSEQDFRLIGDNLSKPSSKGYRT